MNANKSIKNKKQKPYGSLTFSSFKIARTMILGKEIFLFNLRPIIF